MAASTKETIVYDVHDFRVWQMLTDSAANASPTYASVNVDVPAIAEVSLDPNLVTAELKGDGRVVDKRGRIDRFNLSATYGKLAMEVLRVLLGGTITDGTAASRYRYSASDSIPYFACAFDINDNELGASTQGAVRVVLYKCQITGGALIGQSSDSYGQPELEAEAIACESNTSLFFDVTFIDNTTPMTTATTVATLAAAL